MSVIDSLLNFCHTLTDGKQQDMESFKQAAAVYAGEYDIAKLMIETHFRQDAASPNRNDAPIVSRNIVIYEDTDVAALGEPVMQKYMNNSDEYVISYTYPAAGVEFDPQALREIELFSTISYFFFGRLRFGEMIKKGTLTQYMTGLPNSGGYMARAAEILQSGRLFEYDSYYFNIKGFGLVSKKFGFKQGDEMIRQYARSVAGFADPEEIVAHLGGDNFVALIKKAHYATFVSLLQDVNVTAEKGDKEIPVKLNSTIGIWHIDGAFKELSEIISLPAMAMNAAKNVLHQQICHVSDELLFHISEQKKVLESFPTAIRAKEFTVFYQPKVDSRDNSLAGAEALVRWIHGEEIISPCAFVPILEREGAIKALDLYVLENTCLDIRRWIKAGLSPVTVSVNISRKDLDDHTLPYQICDIIDKYEIDHKYIQIEITETTDEAEHDIMIEFLERLSEMGISTAIDDFGSGYSSLSTLRNFKINTLKIDRSFIDNDVFSRNDEIILSDIIHMATMLGVEVITEGVERKEQLDFMNKVGCYLIQGFYYDKPLAPDAFTERLKIGKYDMSI